MDILEVMEYREWDLLPLAVCDQIYPRKISHPQKDIEERRRGWREGGCRLTMSNLRKQQIRLPGRTQITDSIPTIKHHGPVLIWQILIRLNRQTLVMPKVAIIMVDNLPPLAVLVNLDLVADDGDLIRRRTDKVRQQRADDGLHPTREHNHGDVLRQTPRVEGTEARVELDVGAEKLDAFREVGLVGRYRLEHLAEGVAEGHAVLEDLDITGAALFVPVADVVGLGGG